MPKPDRAAARPSTGRDVSRRAVLVAGATVVAGGVGSAIAIGREKNEGHPGPPRELLDAIAAEQQLLATLDASLHRDASLRAVVSQARADHAQHLAALRSEAQGYPAAGPSTGASASGVS